MSRPGETELTLLGCVADEIREVFAERGHRVDEALDVDPAFGSGHSRSGLVRDLAIEAASVSASRLGLDFRPVNGGGREFRSYDGHVDRRYRLRRATRRGNGTLEVKASADSALAVIDDQSTLFPPEQWVMAWTLDSAGQIGEVAVAPIIDFVEGSPGHLVLGAEIPLGGGDIRGRGFLPTDEGLDGFDDEDGLGEESDRPAS